LPANRLQFYSLFFNVLRAFLLLPNAQTSFMAGPSDCGHWVSLIELSLVHVDQAPNRHTSQIPNRMQYLGWPPQGAATADPEFSLAMTPLLNPDKT
jgi:hypothetical protein